MTKYLCQRDPRWAATKIGSAPFTAGQKGCAFTSLLELFQAMTGKKVSAKQYIELVSNPKLFTDKNHKDGPGLILWGPMCAALNAMFKTSFTFDYAEYTNIRRNQVNALKDAKRGCLLQVNNGAHFVTLWKVPAGETKELTVCDPWYGDLEPVLKMYHNVVGARYFKVA